MIVRQHRLNKLMREKLNLIFINKIRMKVVISIKKLLIQI